MSDLFEIIHEDDSLLALNKPAGLVCHPTKGDAYSSLIGRLRLHLGPDSRPRMINRLDRETSGLVLIAKLRQPATELAHLWETREVLKQYLAVVYGHPRHDTGTIEAPLGPDTSSRVAIKDCVTPSGRPARTDFKVLCRFSREDADFSLLEVTPRTGRKHQIRIHLAHSGHPIVGDKIYGPDERLYLGFVRHQLTDHDWSQLLLPHHALHAADIQFAWRETNWHFHAYPEPWFLEFLPPESHEILRPSGQTLA